MSGFTREEIEEFVNLARKHGLTSVEIRQGEKALRFELGPEPASPSSKVALIATEKETPEEVSIVRSNLVGYFRNLQTPIKPGDMVQEDTIIGIIESLGLENEIFAGVDGIIEEIFVVDGQPVEYGQPIAKIRKRTPVAIETRE
ncbi:MAG TPA: biotin/lipoyl-containing protein [Fimbriimonadales bacterium]|nr:biotin/lipoyl-containing protein [Fimbriimonadales bacterium]